MSPLPKQGSGSDGKGLAVTSPKGQDLSNSPSKRGKYRTSDTVSFKNVEVPKNMFAEEDRSVR